MELIYQMSHELGSTVVVVTHDSRIFRFADFIARMDDGRISSFEGQEMTEAFSDPGAPS